MTAVSAKDISLRYDKKDVVKSFSADFTQGKIISIIGPNGSGKSTILRSFARLLNTACGQISLFAFFLVVARDETLSFCHIVDNVELQRAAYLFCKETQ